MPLVRPLIFAAAAALVCELLSAGTPQPVPEPDLVPAVRVVPAPSSPCVPPEPAPAPHAAAAVQWITLSADGRRAAAHRVNGELQVWNLPDGKLIAIIRDGPYHPSFSRDGRWLVGTGPDAQATPLVVFDAGTGEEVFRQPYSIDLRDRRQHVVGVDHEGVAWASLGRGLPRFARYAIPSGELLEVVAAPETAQAAFSPDGTRIVVAGWEAFATRDLAAGADWKVIERYGLPPPRCGSYRQPFPNPLGFLADGRLIVSERAVRFRPELSGPVTFSHDGRRFARLQSESVNGRWRITGVHVYETATLGAIRRAPLPADVDAVALMHDGRQVVVARAGGGLEVRHWDWHAEERPGLADPRPGREWDDLAERDARVALAAVCAMVAAPDAAVRTLGERVAKGDAVRVAALVRDLGNDVFAARERASAELAELGWRAETQLRDAAANSPDAEVRDRAHRLLARVRVGNRGGSDDLRAVRAVEVLERIGSAGARELLARWAADYPGTVLGTEAAAAAGRVARK